MAIIGGWASFQWSGLIVRTTSVIVTCVVAKGADAKAAEFTSADNYDQPSQRKERTGMPPSLSRWMVTFNLTFVPSAPHHAMA